MLDHNRRSNKRIDELTKAIAGCLTPETLEDVLSDITENAPSPVPADLVEFERRMAVQLETL